MKPLRFILLGMMLLFCFTGMFAQIGVPAQHKNDFWDNVRFGGGLGIGFGNGYFSGSISPSAIYDVNPYFSVGPALQFSYQSGENFNTTLYGASLLTLFNPIRELQLSAELEQLRVNQTLELDGGNLEANFWNTALFAGAGYRTQNVTIGVRYNVLYKDGEDIYTSPWSPFVRVYF
ncbi:alpha-ketoglutarate decarboxylase [Marixanthomonas spongiae]|uniref:Alpha-ketoglutarate decarboxylase n=1 Tax=Marixanthomonas spongiae TaxID=2174845 RepID=A0A2U0HZH7_9FLAO|nr:alpha-ketoglutarate decarboxylase [Marixanthomonas spongiae]PVW14275.1 alpha-ketoglutarate decarboxylase [Marixanthomonas spongiae]